MTSIEVRKHDWQGRFRYAWHGALLARRPDRLKLQAIWQGPGEPQVGELCFRRGDRFVERYYPGRGYAIWQVEDADGSLKGWYCNISTPVVEHDGVLSFNDLLLDLLVYPDGRYAVLDRDEFDAARRQGLDAGLARQAEAALAEVLALVEAGAPPFTLQDTARPVDQG